MAKALAADRGQMLERLWENVRMVWSAGDFFAQRLLDEMRQIAAFLTCRFVSFGEQGVIKLNRCLHIRRLL